MKATKAPFGVIVQFVVAMVLVAPAGAVVHTTIYSDGLTTGEWNGPQMATTTTAATVKSMLCCEAVGGGSCYAAVIDKAYAFSYADTIMLPEVGKTFGGGFIDQTFKNSTKVHEDWHKAYIDALLTSTYGALETWSASYTSNKASSEEAAITLGQSDLATALMVAKDAFVADFSTDTTNPAFGHQNAVAVIQNIGGVDTWRSQNPDWGQAAVDHAKAIKVNFTKLPGDCTCVPEPSAALLLVVGGAAMRRRRLARCA
ncbi:MAG: PEP-CTERM sorting domain-containing protein [Lacipirellulaceae bacterium]